MCKMDLSLSDTSPMKIKTFMVFYRNASATPEETENIMSLIVKRGIMSHLELGHVNAFFSEAC